MVRSGQSDSIRRRSRLRVIETAAEQLKASCCRSQLCFEPFSLARRKWWRIISAAQKSQLGSYEWEYYLKDTEVRLFVRIGQTWFLFKRALLFLNLLSTNKNYARRILVVRMKWLYMNIYTTYYGTINDMFPTLKMTAKTVGPPPPADSWFWAMQQHFIIGTQNRKNADRTGIHWCRHADQSLSSWRNHGKEDRNDKAGFRRLRHVWSLRQRVDRGQRWTHGGCPVVGRKKCNRLFEICTVP